MRERVHVPAQPALVRERVVASVQNGGLLTAAETALSARRRSTQEDPPLAARPVSLQSQVTSRAGRTVLAIRAFTAPDSDANQPTLDVNLEIERAGDHVALVLTGVIRPFRDSAGSEVWPDDGGLRAIGQRFLDEMVALVTAASTADRVDEDAPSSDFRSSAG